MTNNDCRDVVRRIKALPPGETRQVNMMLACTLLRAKSELKAPIIDKLLEKVRAGALKGEQSEQLLGLENLNSMFEAENGVVYGHAYGGRKDKGISREALMTAGEHHTSGCYKHEYSIESFDDLKEVLRCRKFRTQMKKQHPNESVDLDLLLHNFGWFFRDAFGLIAVLAFWMNQPARELINIVLAEDDGDPSFFDELLTELGENEQQAAA